MLRPWALPPVTAYQDKEMNQEEKEEHVEGLLHLAHVVAEIAGRQGSSESAQPPELLVEGRERVSGSLHGSLLDATQPGRCNNHLPPDTTLHSTS